ncbi:MAG: hypothetical protein JO291_01935 [Acidimicrobiia bacterium]|nr:hypothetical protein [Acidimicrobiia bacterium]
MNHRLTARLGILGATAAMLVGGIAAGPASAKNGNDNRVERSGNCTATTDWKLKAKPDDGRIEVEFEVDSNHAGQTWAVRIADNGVQVFSGNRMTQPPSGSFSVERRIANRAGVDHIRATAHNARSGETCTGTVQL